MEQVEYLQLPTDSFSNVYSFCTFSYGGRERVAIATERSVLLFSTHHVREAGESEAQQLPFAELKEKTIVAACSFNRVKDGSPIFVLACSSGAEQSRAFTLQFYGTQTQAGAELKAIVADCITLKLGFVPFLVKNSNLLPGSRGRMDVLVSGSDNAVHVFRRLSDYGVYAEIPLQSTPFPELTRLSSSVLSLDVVHFAPTRGDDSVAYRLLVAGCQDGLLRLCAWTTSGPAALKVASVDHYLDGPITGLTFFCESAATQTRVLLRSISPEIKQAATETSRLLERAERALQAAAALAAAAAAASAPRGAPPPPDSRGTEVHLLVAGALGFGIAFGGVFADPLFSAAASAGVSGSGPASASTPTLGRPLSSAGAAATSAVLTDSGSASAEGSAAASAVAGTPVSAAVTAGTPQLPRVQSSGPAQSLTPQSGSTSAAAAREPPQATVAQLKRALRASFARACCLFPSEHVHPSAASASASGASGSASAAGAGDEKSAGKEKPAASTAVAFSEPLLSALATEGESVLCALASADLTAAADGRTRLWLGTHGKGSRVLMFAPELAGDAAAAAAERKSDNKENKQDKRGQSEQHHQQHQAAPFSPQTLRYSLRWQHCTPEPVYSLACVDLVGDGLPDLAVTTQRALQTLQPRNGGGSGDAESKNGSGADDGSLQAQLARKAALASEILRLERELAAKGRLPAGVSAASLPRSVSTG